VRFAHAAIVLLSLHAACGLQSGYAFAGTTLALAVLASKIAVFELFRLHRQLWRTFGTRDVVVYAAANAAASLTAIATYSVVTAPMPPLGVWVTDALLCQALMTGICLAFRFQHDPPRARAGVKRQKRVLLYGAGRTGRLMLHESGIRSDLPYEIAGFLDDDPAFACTSIDTVPVLGTGNDLSRLVDLHQIEEVFVAMPRASVDQRIAIAERIAASGVTARLFPSLSDLIEGRAAVRNVIDAEEEQLPGVQPQETGEASVNLRKPNGPLPETTKEAAEVSEASARESLSRLACVHDPKPADPAQQDPAKPAGASAEEKRGL
jgi:FlaA1/EpsC-like NDP-sugar epimerase